MARVNGVLAAVIALAGALLTPELNAQPQTWTGYRTGCGEGSDLANRVSVSLTGWRASLTFVASEITMLDGKLSPDGKIVFRGNDTGDINARYRFDGVLASGRITGRWNAEGSRATCAKGSWVVARGGVTKTEQPSPAPAAPKTKAVNLDGVWRGKTRLNEGNWAGGCKDRLVTLTIVGTQITIDTLNTFSGKSKTFSGQLNGEAFEVRNQSSESIYEIYEGALRKPDRFEGDVFRKAGFPYCKGTWWAERKR